MYDESLGGWHGLDFDMLTAFAARLGFNYTVRSFEPEDGEEWTAWLYRVTPQADIVVTYWARTEERLSSFAMMYGHVDMRCDRRPPPLRVHTCDRDRAAPARCAAP